MKQENNIMNFTEESFEDFCIEYELALETKKKSFIFQGRKVLVEYAKYMIEFLTLNFNKNGKRR